MVIIITILNIEEGDKLLTVEEYLALIEPCLRELINDYKSKGEWKIQLTAQINFISLFYFLYFFCKDIKKIYKKKLEVHILRLMALIFCIMIFIK